MRLIHCETRMRGIEVDGLVLPAARHADTVDERRVHPEAAIVVLELSANVEPPRAVEVGALGADPVALFTRHRLRVCREKRSVRGEMLALLDADVAARDAIVVGCRIPYPTGACRHTARARN